jgi:alpha-ketoglutarate-dependent taurine dioxygenase
VTPETPGFPAVWLRHNCPCPDCRDPVTGQRLLKISDIPNGLVATVTAQHDTEIVVTFAPDGHRSVFRRDWLAAQALAAQGGADSRTEDGKVLWRAAHRGLGRVHERRPGAGGLPRRGGQVRLRAAALRAADPGSFGVLTGTPVPFGYIDKETELTARQPLISLSPGGRIAGIRYNDRSMLPLRLPPAEAEAAYAAIFVWARLPARPEFLLRLRLSPGDRLIFDNTRVLHARTAFAATGERRLQGCYADLDGLLSTLAVLRRRQ